MVKAVDQFENFVRLSLSKPSSEQNFLKNLLRQAQDDIDFFKKFSNLHLGLHRRLQITELFFYGFFHSWRRCCYHGCFF